MFVPLFSLDPANRRKTHRRLVKPPVDLPRRHKRRAAPAAAHSRPRPRFPRRQSPLPPTNPAHSQAARPPNTADTARPSVRFDIARWSASGETARQTRPVPNSETAPWKKRTTLQALRSHSFAACPAPCLPAVQTPARARRPAVPFFEEYFQKSPVYWHNDDKVLPLSTPARPQFG